MNRNFAFETSDNAHMAGLHPLLAAPLDRVAERLRQRIVEAISRPGATSGARRSAPGEPPRVETGKLRERVVVESVDPLTRRVLASAPHGHFLEVGTRVMKPRPYLVKTLEELAAELDSDTITGAEP
jgi:hypothetical protein